MNFFLLLRVITAAVFVIKSFTILLFIDLIFPLSNSFW